MLRRIKAPIPLDNGSPTILAHCCTRDGIGEMRKVSPMYRFVSGCLRTLGLVAFAFGGVAVQNTHAGMVFSTAGAGNRSDTSVTAPNNTTNSYSIGQFSAGSVWTFDGRGYGNPGFRFTTGGATNQRLNAVGINLFYDEDGGTPGAGSVASMVLTWQLYAGTSAVSAATFTQTVTNISHANGSVGPNLYAGNGTTVTNPVGGNTTSTWALTSAFGSNNLTSGVNYTMVMTGATVSGLTNVAGDEIHWNIKNNAVANGGTYALAAGQAVGYIPTGTGGSGTFTATATNMGNAANSFAFDIDASAVPEPSTLILYSAAAGGFFLFSFLRWKKTRQTVQPVSV